MIILGNKMPVASHSILNYSLMITKMTKHLNCEKTLMNSVLIAQLLDNVLQLAYLKKAGEFGEVFIWKMAKYPGNSISTGLSKTGLISGLI